MLHEIAVCDCLYAGLLMDSADSELRHTRSRRGMPYRLAIALYIVSLTFKRLEKSGGYSIYFRFRDEYHFKELRSGSKKSNVECRDSSSETKKSQRGFWLFADEKDHITSNAILVLTAP